MRETHVRAVATFLFSLCLSVSTASAAPAAKAADSTMLTAALRSVEGAAEPARDPVLVIPFCVKPPVIDGKLSPGEWDCAAAVSMMETYEACLVRKEQTVFYVCWDKKYLYIAMESNESRFSDGVVANCVMHDHGAITADDCIELMLSPGAGEDLHRFDLPVYYLVLNSMGTVLDTSLFPLLNEEHNEWESGVECANSTDGARWVCEMRIPFDAMTKKTPQAGTVWRMNFVRTFSGYYYSAWNCRAGLNDANTGCDATFTVDSAVVRLIGAGETLAGKLQVPMQVANPSDRRQTVTLRTTCTGRDKENDEPAALGADQKAVTVEPGEVTPISLGAGEALRNFNLLTLEATDEAGQRLFFVERRINLPPPQFTKTPAPKPTLVSVVSRFLPSLKRLVVSVNLTAWAKKTGGVGGTPTAKIAVFPKGAADGNPVMEGELSEFKDNVGVWRQSTKALPEGEYVVKVTVASGTGETIEQYDDWFEKRTFEWMSHPRGVGEAVPAPFTPLVVSGNEVQSWGRTYAFAPTGLPQSISSQNKPILTGPVELSAEADGKPLALRVVTPFAFTDCKPGKVTGKAALASKNLRVDLESVTEYDGFTLFQLTYAPVKGSCALSRMRVRIPIAAERALFYSAAGDTEGTCIQADVFPAKQGTVYDSLVNTHCVCCSPTFATLFWVADRDVSFCYAADNDKGWLIRDDAPAVEAIREGDTVALWLNLVDKPWTLTAPRTLEFALQAGPTKPLPEGWRGVQDCGHPTDAPIQLLQVGKDQSSTVPGDSSFNDIIMYGGGLCSMHPGVTPEEQRRSRERLESLAEGGRKSLIGYNWWPHTCLGFPEARVFRGEWGIGKEPFETVPNFMKDATNYIPEPGFEGQFWAWKEKIFGENKFRYVEVATNAAPSYVDFLIYAYDLALTCTPICGNYDDCGYPHPVYDEELGIGFVREDGRKVWSSGLWAMRDRWKRAQYVNFVHSRPNCLSDSQSCFAQFMPAQNFIGLWRPCERGYYNPFKDRDNIDFYRTLERYAAYNPAKQFGQIPAGIGMTSPHRGVELAKDTRGMIMLAFLHDQDLGCFTYANRDSKVIGELRRAKNLFRPWENEVGFIGYWEISPLIASSPDTVRVSMYTRPDSLLLFVGNIGDGATTATITPAWAALKLDSKLLTVTDAETGAPVPLKAGSAQSLEVQVERHDLRIILIAPAGRFRFNAPGLIPPAFSRLTFSVGWSS